MGTVTPTTGSTVDVLYHVRGRHAYFRGVVRRTRQTEHGRALTIDFEHQRHYGLTFPAETATIIPAEPGIARVVRRA